MAREIGIDIGTSSIRIYVKGEGRISSFSNVIALDRDDEIIEFGLEAKKMLGRVPKSIKTVKPMNGGAVVDCESIAMLLNEIFNKLDLLSLFNKPIAYVSVPSNLTEVEKTAIETAVLDAGAVKVILVQNAIAGAIGADIDIKSQKGSMLVQIGGGYTEVSVFSMSRPVLIRSDRIGGEDIDRAIVSYFTESLGFSIGDLTAERLKIKLGTALPLIDRGSALCFGRDLVSRRPKQIEVKSGVVSEAIRPVVESILGLIKATIKETPPELLADIYENGIVLAGGTASLAGLTEYIQRELGIKAIVSKKSLNNVAQGIGKIIEQGSEILSIAEVR